MKRLNWKKRKYLEQSLGILCGLTSGVESERVADVCVRVHRNQDRAHIRLVRVRRVRRMCTGSAIANVGIFIIIIIVYGFTEIRIGPTYV